MAIHRWPLAGSSELERGGDFSLASDQLPIVTASWRVTAKTLRTGMSTGVDVVEIDNGRICATVVPTRGMGLWRITAGEQVLGWQSPVRGPVHPAFVPLSEPSGLGWLSGFDELMCRCGLESNGAPDFDDDGQLRYPLHGRVANLPARDVQLEIDDVAGTIAVRGVVEESRFHYQKLRMHSQFVMEFGTTKIGWNDEVSNFGGTPAEMQMLYHINVGRPLLDANSQLIAPIEWVAPGNADTASMGIEPWDLYRAPDPRFRQQVYQLGLLADERGRTAVLLKNGAGSSAVEVAFDVRQLPCFSLWKNTVAEEDGYVTGIEPATNFPNPRSQEREQGRVVTLQAGERWNASVELTWLMDAGAVDSAAAALRSRQTCTPVVHQDIYSG
jgi:hypothetical protein